MTGLPAHGDPDPAYGEIEKVIRYRKGALDFVAGPVATEFFNVIRSRPGTRTRQRYAPDEWAQAEAYIDDGQIPDDAVGLDDFRRA